MSNPYIPLLCFWAMLIMVMVELNEPAPIEPTECVETIECDTIVKPNL